MSTSLQARFQNAGVAEFAASPPRRAWLEQLSEVYRDQGVLSEDAAPSLCDACPDAAECWEPFAEDQRPNPNAENWGLKSDEAGSIILPWIGGSYEPGGVAVLGLNFRDSGEEITVALEYLSAVNELVQLADGRRINRYRSRFAYRSLASAAVILASLDGEPLTRSPDAAQLVAVLERIARLQLVKCRPLGGRGAPGTAMCKNCPPRFLHKELEILAPSAIVAFGNRAYDTLTSLEFGTRWSGGSSRFARGTLTRADVACEVFWLAHPAAQSDLWMAGQRSLITSLRRKPIAARH